MNFRIDFSIFLGKKKVVGTAIGIAQTLEIAFGGPYRDQSESSDPRARDLFPSIRAFFHFFGTILSFSLCESLFPLVKFIPKFLFFFSYYCKWSFLNFFFRVVHYRRIETRLTSVRSFCVLLLC